MSFDLGEAPEVLEDAMIAAPLSAATPPTPPKKPRRLIPSPDASGEPQQWQKRWWRSDSFFRSWPDMGDSLVVRVFVTVQPNEVIPV
jgi:hypothetical protein